MGTSIFRYSWLFLVCWSFCISCQPKLKNGTDGAVVLPKEAVNAAQPIKPPTTKAANTAEEAIKYSLEDFAELIDSLPQEPLPYLVGEEMFSIPDYRTNERVRKMIAYKGHDLGTEFGKDHFNDSTVLKVIGSEYARDFSLYKRLVPRNERIELLVFSSNLALILASFDKQTMTFVDDRVLSLHGESYFGYDTYFSSGACVNPNFSAYNIISSGWESPPFIEKRKMQITSNGNIVIETLEEYSSSNIDVLDDYTKPYYRDLREVEWSVSSEKRALLFVDDFLSKIPEVGLPYSSDGFNSLFRVWNPAEGDDDKSTIFLDKLVLPETSALFFSNDTATTAFHFDLSSDKWSQGPFFYPVLKFHCGEHVAVGFLYRSLLRGSPAFHFQINTYTSGGVIVDRKVIGRSFFNEIRVVNEFTINKDFTINVIETIEDFEMMAYDGFEEHQAPAKTRKWQFTIAKDGSISKSGPVK